MKVVICVDDVHPETGWGLPDDSAMIWMEELYKKYGAKCTLFIPANYRRKYPISLHLDWINGLLSKPYFELAAHGMYHDSSDRRRFGECEFGELRDIEVISERLNEMWDMWDAVGYWPIGWRSPGWLCSQESATQISNLKLFKYVAVHYEHDRGVEWGPNITKFYGHDGIQSTDISVHNNDMIVFQSHINGNHNDNVWSENNYKQLDLSLQHLVNTYPEVEFATFSECINKL